MRVRLIALVTLAVGLSVGPAMAAPILSISPSATTVNVGDTFSVDINISDVTDLYGWGFDLNFDDARLDPDGQVTEGTFLSGGGATSFFPGFYPGITLTSGSIEFVLDFLIGAVPGVSGSGTLATMSFLAQAPGTPAFFLTNWLLQDSADPGNIIDPTDVLGASVTINPVTAEVPEPATLLLLGSGLAIAARRRQTRSRTTI